MVHIVNDNIHGLSKHTKIYIDGVDVTRHVKKVNIKIEPSGVIEASLEVKDVNVDVIALEKKSTTITLWKKVANYVKKYTN